MTCSPSSRVLTYRGFSIWRDAQIGWVFSDGFTEWAARSSVHARKRIDAILFERGVPFAFPPSGAFRPH
jgi:hypothetical protein